MSKLKQFFNKILLSFTAFCVAVKIWLKKIKTKIIEVIDKIDIMLDNFLKRKGKNDDKKDKGTK